MPRKEPLYPHVPKSREPIYPRATGHSNISQEKSTSATHPPIVSSKMRFTETRNLEGGLDRAVRFFDDQNKPLAEVSFGDVGEVGIVIQEIKALGKQLTKSDFIKIIGSVEKLAVQNKKPVVWVQSRAKDNWLYLRLGYTFDEATGTYVKNVLGGKVPTMKAEDVMFKIAGESPVTPKTKTGLPVSKTFVSELGYDVELHVARALEILNLGGENTISSGFHTKLYGGKWMIILREVTGYLHAPSQAVFTAAKKAGMNIIVRNGDVQRFYDIILPDVAKDEIDRATEAFDSFGKEYARIKKLNWEEQFASELTRR